MAARPLIITPGTTLVRTAPIPAMLELPPTTASAWRVESMGLVRLDAYPYHSNPDGTELRNQPHLHVHVRRVTRTVQARRRQLAVMCTGSHQILQNDTSFATAGRPAGRRAGGRLTGAPKDTQSRSLHQKERERARQK